MPVPLQNTPMLLIKPAWKCQIQYRPSKHQDKVTFKEGCSWIRASVTWKQQEETGVFLDQDLSDMKTARPKRGVPGSGPQWHENSKDKEGCSWIRASVTWKQQGQRGVFLDQDLSDMKTARTKRGVPGSGPQWHENSKDKEGCSWIRTSATWKQQGQRGVFLDQSFSDMKTASTKRGVPGSGPQWHENSKDKEGCSWIRTSVTWKQQGQRGVFLDQGFSDMKTARKNWGVPGSGLRWHENSKDKEGCSWIRTSVTWKQQGQRGVFLDQDLSDMKTARTKKGVPGSGPQWHENSKDKEGCSWIRASVTWKQQGKTGVFLDQGFGDMKTARTKRGVPGSGPQWHENSKETVSG